MAANLRYDYINQDLPGVEILAILGELPKRWGRMDRLSRLAVVEVGRVLQDAGRLEPAAGISICRGQGGLIGATRRGSLATDLAYAETLALGSGMASPTLFSYTLPNIALAEAASHFHLTGPVYSIFVAGPEDGAEAAAQRWLADDGSLDFMVAGELDVYPDPLQAGAEVISVNFKIVS